MFDKNCFEVGFTHRIWYLSEWFLLLRPSSVYVTVLCSMWSCRERQNGCRGEKCLQRYEHFSLILEVKTNSSQRTLFSPSCFPWSKAPRSSTWVRKILVSSKRSSWSNQINMKQYAGILKERGKGCKERLGKIRRRKELLSMQLVMNWQK